MSTNNSHERKENVTLQKTWTALTFSHEKQNILQSVPAVDKARIIGCSATHAGDWLLALPSPFLGLHMNDHEVIITFGLRLGAKLYQKHTCSSGAIIDQQGHISLICKQIASKHVRHSLINEVVHRAFKSAMIPSSKEPTGLSPFNNLRPDGFTLIPWSCGKSLVWDATCVHRLAKSYQRISLEYGSSVVSLANKLLSILT